MTLLWFVACTGEDPSGSDRPPPTDPPVPVPTAPEPTRTAFVEAPPVACADPAARIERTWDELVIDTDPPLDRRFVGSGLVAGDFDGDLDLDLVVPGPFGARYLANRGGGSFVDVAGVLPDVDYTDAVGGATADFDADGDLDLVITRWGPPDFVLVNEGGVFADRGTLPPVPRHSQTPAWADLNLDGALDLVIAGHGVAEEIDGVVTVDHDGDPSGLYLGDGQGGLVDHTADVDPVLQSGYSFVVGPTELDGDGLPDLLFANDYPTWLDGMPGLQDTDGTFRRGPGTMGLDVHRAGMGLAIGDVNGDGWDDFLQPVWDYLVYLRSTDAGVWVDASVASNFDLPAHDPAFSWVGWGAELVDVDNDGDLDAVTAWGRLDTIGPYFEGGARLANAEDQQTLVHVQVDGSFYRQLGLAGLPQTGAWRGFVAADLNDDGWIDFARRDLNGRLIVDLSRCGAASWLRVVPEPPSRAVGAVVTVTAGALVVTRTVRAGGTSLDSGGPPEVLIGLGAAEEVDRIEVRWPDGAITTGGPTYARQRLVVNAP